MSSFAPTPASTQYTKWNKYTPQRGSPQQQETELGLNLSVLSYLLLPPLQPACSCFSSFTETGSIAATGKNAGFVRALEATDSLWEAYREERNCTRARQGVMETTRLPLKPKLTKSFMSTVQSPWPCHTVLHQESIQLCVRLGFATRHFAGPTFCFLLLSPWLLKPVDCTESTWKLPGKIQSQEVTLDFCLNWEPFLSATTASPSKKRKATGT